MSAIESALVETGVDALTRGAGGVVSRAGESWANHVARQASSELADKLGFEFIAEGFGMSSPYTLATIHEAGFKCEAGASTSAEAWRISRIGERMLHLRLPGNEFFETIRDILCPASEQGGRSVGRTEHWPEGAEHTVKISDGPGIVLAFSESASEGYSWLSVRGRESHFDVPFSWIQKKRAHLSCLLSNLVCTMTARDGWTSGSADIFESRVDLINVVKLMALFERVTRDDGDYLFVANNREWDRVSSVRFSQTIRGSSFEGLMIVSPDVANRVNADSLLLAGAEPIKGMDSAEGFASAAILSMVGCKSSTAAFKFLTQQTAYGVGLAVAAWVNSGTREDDLADRYTGNDGLDDMYSDYAKAFYSCSSQVAEIFEERHLLNFRAIPTDVRLDTADAPYHWKADNNKWPDHADASREEGATLDCESCAVTIVAGGGSRGFGDQFRHAWIASRGHLDRTTRYDVSIDREIASAMYRQFCPSCKACEMCESCMSVRVKKSWLYKHKNHLVVAADAWLSVDARHRVVSVLYRASKCKFIPTDRQLKRASLRASVLTAVYPDGHGRAVVHPHLLKEATERAACGLASVSARFMEIVDEAVNDRYELWEGHNLRVMGLRRLSNSIKATLGANAANQLMADMVRAYCWSGLVSGHAKGEYSCSALLREVNVGIIDLDWDAPLPIHGVRIEIPTGVAVVSKSRHHRYGVVAHLQRGRMTGAESKLENCDATG